MSSNTQVATAPQINPLTTLMPTMDDINVMGTMAKIYCAAGTLGTKIPEEIMSLMLVAQAEGRPVAIVARDYHIVKGRPTLKSEAMQSRFTAMGGVIEFLDASDAICRATFTRGKTSVTIDWDIARAQRAGLATTNANWQKYPRAMLKARCVSEGVRMVAPEVLSGLYCPEEVQEFDEPPHTPAAPAYDPKLAVSFDATPTRNIRVAGPKTAHVAPQTTPVEHGEQTPTSAQKRPENATTTSTLSERKTRPDSEIADDLDWDAFNDLADSACALGMPSSKFPQLNRGATLGELRRACAVVKQAMEELRSGRVYSAARAAAKTEQVEPVAANSANSANSDDEWAGIDMDEEV
jgi:hypothetical protein